MCPGCVFYARFHPSFYFIKVLNFSKSGTVAKAHRKLSPTVSSLCMSICEACFLLHDFLFFLLVHVISRIRIYKLSPIEVASVERHNDNFGGGNISCYGNIVSVAHKKQVLLYLIVL